MCLCACACVHVRAVGLFVCASPKSKRFRYSKSEQFAHIFLSGLGTHMCEYVCVSVCVCVCVYVCICVYNCAYVFVYACTCVCMCVCAHVHTCVCTLQVETLRSERDALRVRAEMLQGKIDSQHVQPPSTVASEEIRRLLALVAELRQKMSDMQEENAATKARLDMQVIRATKLQRTATHCIRRNETHSRTPLQHTATY